jgi:WD40 repeat protein/predicted Ser/Thr protein kinase
MSTDRDSDNLDEIDAACDRFEAAWRNGEQPRVEDYLVQASERARPKLLIELERVQHALQGTTQPEVVSSKRSARTPPEKKSAAQDKRSKRIFGDYELIRELGKGGMGVVYLARQRSADRLVALKLIRVDRLEQLSGDKRREWLHRFRTEGQATARIADDRVVPVYEVGALNGRPFYSMRYVAGRSLATVFETGPLPNRSAAILIEQVARAVQAIHDQGVLHRDLKPHNILLDAQGRPYVSDFGLAKWIDAADSPTHTGELLGSPQFMSPEQAQDASQVSKVTDVYGLGATLYALLTGQPPFKGKTVAETLHQVKYREPAPPRRVNPAVDRDLETITLKCLDKDPERRFLSAAEVANELKRYLEGRPIRTRPLGPAGRSWRWCRRNPGIALLSACALVLIIVAGTVFWSYRSAAESKELAEGQVDDLTNQARKAEGEKKEQEDVAKLEQGRKRRLEYLEDMAQASQAWEGYNIAKMRRLLDRYRPQPGMTDLRRWEWYYLNALSKRHLLTLAGPPARFTLWSPDGQCMATADDKTLRVWSLAADKEPVTLSNRVMEERCIAWSVDSHRLATVTADRKRVFIYEVASGKDTAELAPTDPVRFIAWSPDGKWLATKMEVPQGAEKGHPSSIVWDVNTGKAVNLLTDGEAQPSWFGSVLWAPKGQDLAFTCPKGIRVWSAGSWTTLEFHAGGSQLPQLWRWSPNGQQLASSAADRTFKVWNTLTNKEVFTIKSNHPMLAGPSSLTSFGYSVDGSQVAWVGMNPNSDRSNGILKVLDANAGTIISASRLSFKDIISDLVWSSDGQSLAMIGQNGSVSINDVSTGDPGNPDFQLIPSRHQSLKASLPGLIGTRASWSPDGKRLAVARPDEAAEIWDASRNPHKPTAILQYGPFESFLPWDIDTVSSVDWTPDSQRFLYLSQEGRGAFWEVAAKNPLLAFENPRGGRRRWGKQNQSGLWSPDGKRFAAGCEDGTIRVWDASKGTEILSLRSHSAQVSCVAWGPEGKRLASGSADHTVKLWDAITGKLLITSTGHLAPILEVAWSPSGQQVASLSEDGAVKVWQLTTHKPLFTNETNGNPFNYGNTLNWSPTGQYLALVADANNVEVRDGRTGNNVCKITISNPNSIASVVWSPDARHLAIGSSGLTPGLGVWDVPSGEPSSSVQPAKITVELGVPIAWSPDSEQLASISGGSIRAWALRSGKPTPALQGLNGSVESLVWSSQNRELIALAINRDRKNHTEHCYSQKWDVATGLLKRNTLLYESPTGWSAGAFFAWSPDQRRIAFEGDELAAAKSLQALPPGINYGNGDIGVFDIDKNAVPIILHRPWRIPRVSSAMWNPDGQRVAMAVANDTRSCFITQFVTTCTPKKPGKTSLPGSQKQL